MATDATAMKDTARRLGFHVTDTAVLAPVERAVALLADPTELDGIHRDPVTAEARSSAYAHLNRIRKAWDDVERAVIALVADR
jgi:hypothetical protein